MKKNIFYAPFFDIEMTFNPASVTLVNLVRPLSSFAKQNAVCRGLQLLLS